MSVTREQRYSLTREATWSTPIKIKSGRCLWPWCWRQATRMCRGMVLAGHQIVTFGRWHCDKHIEKRKTLNLRVLDALAALAEDNE